MKKYGFNVVKIISILSIIIISGVGVFAQAETYSTPVKWERYKISELEVSFLFPKLPIVQSSFDSCRQIRSNEYITYAEKVVYSLKIYTKLSEEESKQCPEHIAFSEDTLKKRFEEIVRVDENSKRESLELKEKKATKITTVRKDTDLINTYWIIEDLKNNRWFEFSVIHKNGIVSKSKLFIESLQTDKNVKGIEIGKGAERILGDDGNWTGNNVEKNFQFNEKESDNVIFIRKAAPKYTDAARQANIKGHVILQITLLANGGIGEIIPIESLSHGLTEEAIKVAQKIVFIPAISQGINYSTTQQIQYQFSIY